MENLSLLIRNYLDFCQNQKRLDKKTLKAYRIDLNQFIAQSGALKITDITSDALEASIAALHQIYKPKTV